MKNILEKDEFVWFIVLMSRGILLKAGYLKAIWKHDGLTFQNLTSPAGHQNSKNHRLLM